MKFVSKEREIDDKGLEAYRDHLQFLKHNRGMLDQSRLQSA